VNRSLYNTLRRRMEQPFYGLLDEVHEMKTHIDILRHIYSCFNARDLDGALDALADDVEWANGMDGGHVHGREGVREYWTRQWAVVSPNVIPHSFTQCDDGSILVEVVQSIRDLRGQPLQNPSHGLRDKTVGHVFHLKDGLVTRFDIQNAG
jgi:hypothetical protein